VDEAIAATIETFAKDHPAMNPRLLLEHARVALARYHSSPANFRFYYGKDEYSATVAFDSPDPRSQDTLEREDFVEKGAIVMAGSLLRQFAGKQITRVLRRGDHVDYFVGEAPDDTRWILEVGGTDEQSFAGLRNDKRRQLEGSPYRYAPHRKDGYVSVTRFAPAAAAACDIVPSA
jgi:hypothetical protein